MCDYSVSSFYVSKQELLFYGVMSVSAGNFIYNVCISLEIEVYTHKTPSSFPVVEKFGSLINLRL